MVCGSRRRKSRLAKAAGAEPSGQMRDEQWHVVVARSTCPIQNLQSTRGPEHLMLRRRKSARLCGAKHMSKTKCTKHLSSRAPLGVEMLKKCALYWCEAHYEVKSKNVTGTEHFLTFICRFVWQAQGIAHFVPHEKFAKVLYNFQQSDGKRGTSEEDLNRCISCGKGNTRDMFIRDVVRSGR